MQEATKYCPRCKEWVFHIDGICPKCNYLFPKNIFPQEQEEPQEDFSYHYDAPQTPQTPEIQEEEEESVWEKYAPWNEWKLDPMDKKPWEWNPWENTNSNDDSFNSDPFNNDPWKND